MIRPITSLNFIMFVLAQPPNRGYDMRDELKNCEVGSPLQHYCRTHGIRYAATGSMDVYDKNGKVVAALELPTQAHFETLDMEAGGTYGELQRKIRSRYLEQINVPFGESPKPPMKGAKLTSRRLTTQDDKAVAYLFGGNPSGSVRVIEVGPDACRAFNKSLS